MPTVLEVINLSTDYLKDKGIESPRINAELLLAKILNCKRLDLYLAFDRPLIENELSTYRDFLKRRSKNEPLQYIVGSVEFYGLEFIVNNNVLIPRQETEILVETIVNANKDRENLKILDIGTGSGIIAVCLAKLLTNSSVTAVDYSNDALAVAKQNADANGVGERLCFIHHDIIAGTENIGSEYDIVVSNPPYISTEEFPGLQPELIMYEPKMALTDGSDGFTFFRVITEKSKSLLKSGGMIYFEVGQGQYSRVLDILNNAEYKNVNTFKDYLNIERVVYGELK